MNTSVPHFLDLHKDRNDLAHFATKVVFEETVSVCVEYLHECTQIPLLGIACKSLIRYTSLRSLYVVLTIASLLKTIHHIHAQFLDKIVK